MLFNLILLVAEDFQMQQDERVFQQSSEDEKDASQNPSLKSANGMNGRSRDS
jgi:hypothetical protein